MSITVVCTLRPQPEHAGAIVQQAIAHLSGHGIDGRRSARLYQPLDDRTSLLYVAEWDSREAFEAYRQTAQMPGSPEQYRELPVCRVYRRLALFERMLAPVRHACAIVVDGTPATHAACQGLALAYHRASLHGQSDLVLLTIHETTDERPGLLVLWGWGSALGHEPLLPDSARQLIERFRATGATIEEMVGRALVDAADT
ncbi:MAG: antibiotic biosynthesis monooxygenase family protein [Chloroflexota bacterium]